MLRHFPLESNCKVEKLANSSFRILPKILKIFKFQLTRWPTKFMYDQSFSISSPFLTQGNGNYYKYDYFITIKTVTKGSCKKVFFALAFRNI